MKNYFKSGAWNAICSSCNVEKSISDFYLHSNGKPRKQCKSCRLEIQKTWFKNNPETVLKLARRFREKHYDLCLTRTREWRKRNLEYDAFRTATYKARKLKQTPSWANLDKIKEIYLNCPKGHQVDHIIPLKGKLVTGFHIETNLQYLLAKDNLVKRNYYDP